MKHSIYMGAIVAAMFVLGLSVSGLAMESKSGDAPSSVKATETIHAWDENAHFEGQAESAGALMVDVAREMPASDEASARSSNANAASTHVVLEEHDYILYP